MLGGGRGGLLLSNPFLQVTLLLLALDIPQGLPGKEGAPLSRKSEQSERQTQGGGGQGHIAPLTQHPGTHPQTAAGSCPSPQIRVWRRWLQMRSHGRARCVQDACEHIGGHSAGVRSACSLPVSNLPATSAPSCALAWPVPAECHMDLQWSPLGP